MIDQLFEQVAHLGQQMHLRRARAVPLVEVNGARGISLERIDITPPRMGWCRRGPTELSTQVRCRRPAAVLAIEVGRQVGRALSRAMAPFGGLAVGLLGGLLCIGAIL